MPSAPSASRRGSSTRTTRRAARTRRPDPLRSRTPLLAAAVAIFVAAGALLFTSSGRDDCYISFWPALTFAREGRVLNYAGQAVEQSSTLLFVLLSGSLHRLTRIPLPLLGLLLSVLFGALSVVWTARLAGRLRAGSEVAAALLVAPMVPLLYWSFSGMETSLQAFLVLLLVERWAAVAEDGRRSDLVWLALVAAAYLLVRPESPLILVAGLSGALVGAAWVSRGDGAPLTAAPRVRRALVAVAAGVLLAGGLFALRRAWFHDWFPLPVRAKVEPLSGEVIGRGFEYLKKHLWTPQAGSLPVVLVLALGAVVWLRRLDARARALAVAAWAFLGAQLAFVVTSGGDWMEGGRFLVSSVPLAVLLAVAGVGALPRGARVTQGALIGVAALGLGLFVAGKESLGVPFWALSPALPSKTTPMSWIDRYNVIHHRDQVFYGPLRDTVARIARHTGGPVHILSGQAGVLVYQLQQELPGQIDYIDQAGLSTRHFVDCPLSKNMPKRAVGMTGMSAYYVEHMREVSETCHIPMPDVIFGRRKSPSQYSPRFEEEYTMVLLERDQVLTRPGLVRREYDGQFAMVRKDLAKALGLTLQRLGE